MRRATLPPDDLTEPLEPSADAKRLLRQLHRYGPVWQILVRDITARELERLGAIRPGTIPLAPPWTGDAQSWEITEAGRDFVQCGG